MKLDLWERTEYDIYMRIILKFLLRNIKEKKLRTGLIIFSITLSTALLFSTLAISGTVRQMITNQMTKYTSDSEIVVQLDSQTRQDLFFEMNESSKLNEMTEYRVGMISGGGIYQQTSGEEMQVVVLGYNLEDLKKMHQIDLTSLNTFEDNQVIIGQGEADAFGFKQGDTLTIGMNGESHSFEIVKIAPSVKLFNYDGSSMTIVLPKETLASLSQSEGEINRLYVKTTKDATISEVISELESVYNHSDYIIKTTITPSQIDQNISGITSTFSLMLVLVIFISIFIIFTSFKVITMERLPMVGTFRSIGATKKMTDIILLGESMVYGMIGGFLGCILGFGILSFMMNTIAYNAYTGVKAQVEMVFGIEHLVIAFLFALILSMISSMLPIIKVSKIPVRNIVLNNIRELPKMNRFKTILGLLFISLPTFYMHFASNANLMLGIVALILIGAGLIMIVPFLTKQFVYLIEKGIHIIFGNEGVLAAKNLRENKNIMNNISLLMIGIASILMINTVSQTVAKEVVNVFSDARFELSFILPRADDETIKEVESITGVKSANGLYQFQNVKLKQQNDYVDYLWGVDPNNYFDYWDFDVEGDEEQLLQQLKTERGVLTTNVIKDKYNLRKGDSITIDYKGQDLTYEVIGFVNTLMQNGNVIFVSDQHIKDDTSIYYYSEIMIKTNIEPKEMIQNIKTHFPNEVMQFIEIKEYAQRNMENNNQMFMLLQGFSIITMIIGIFGIFNNYVVSLITRKRSLAVYRSIGMTKKQVLKMLLIEALIGGIIGGLIGIFGGALFINLAEYITKAISLPVPMDYPIRLFAYGLISGIVLSVVSSILPALRSSKLNMIEEIKYE